MASSLENEVDLPLIELSQIPLEFDGVNNLQFHPAVARVGEACKEWGFFRVVDSGIPTDLLQNLESVSRQICDMPPEVKDRAIGSIPYESYFRYPLRESFCIQNLPQSDSVQALSNKIWPNNENPKFSETVGAYADFLAGLQRKIFIIILASLGLDVKTFYHSDFQECTAYLHINHYYGSDGKSSKQEALETHTDISCFTILYQDNEGGLQIRSKEGEMFNVKSVSNSFIVNIGNCFKAWSNGRYRSSEHRVVFKGWTDRISLGWFVLFPNDQQILAPAELVDDDYPRRYKPFTFYQYKQGAWNNFLSKKETYTTFMEDYAGISSVV